MVAAHFEVGRSGGRVFARGYCLHRRRARRCPRDTLLQRSRRYPSSAFATRNFAHGSTDSVEQFERQATHLLTRFPWRQRKCGPRLLLDCCRAARASRARSGARGARAYARKTLLEDIVWPDETTTARFYTQRALAWRKALRGDWIPAMHLLDGAFALAPDAMRRGIIFADRARISMAIGEHVSAASSRANAFECFSEVEWKSSSKGRGHGRFCGYGHPAR